MTKLNQIIAIANGRKTQAKESLTHLYQRLQKPDLLSGLVRTYQPKDEEGEKLPDEEKGVQVTTSAAITEARAALTRLFDTIATQDAANTKAVADVVVNGSPLLKAVPVTHLLFLEHQLVDLAAFVNRLPVLDPADTWDWDSNSNLYRSKPAQTLRTKKVPKAFVKYEATKEHPAQVEAFTEDVVIGAYTLTKFSGGIPAEEKEAMKVRVRELQEAVKKAREEANSTEVTDVKEGEALLSYIFDGDDS